MAAALPYITTAITAYSAKKSADGPKKTKVREQPDPNNPVAKRNAQREIQRRNNSGRTSTVLSGASTLG